ncbi:MAG TPA: 30S ribosome-binding factor RbfA [Thermoanaerobaculia bacterium]|nr:30S ribosome-binding factor RbfA [Thermoanaerobaculia bacterium]
MKRTRRSMQVGEALRGEIARIIGQELRDPDLSLATITDVEMSPDLHFARVWISSFGDEAKRQAALAAVKRADGTIRHHLAKAKAFRFIPEIDWKLDSSAIYASAIETRLREVLPEGSGDSEDVPDDQRSTTDDQRKTDDHD